MERAQKPRKGNLTSVQASKDGEQENSRVIPFEHQPDIPSGDNSGVQQLKAALNQAQPRLQHLQKCEQNLLQMSGLPEGNLELGAHSLRGVNVGLEAVRWKIPAAQKEVGGLVRHTFGLLGS